MGREITELKAGGGKAAVVFVHGFTGKATETWGDFPKHLGGLPQLKEWDLKAFGYDTSMKPDLAGIWSGDPKIQTVADELRRCLQIDLAKYKALVLVAHSMGGLVVQRALADDAAAKKKQFMNRVTAVVNFGAPSGGLKKASVFRLPILRFLKRQIADMDAGGEFITKLRKDWRTAFGGGTPFYFAACGGASDEFVPIGSSLEPFPAEQTHVVPGNHLTIVKPDDAKHPSVVMVARAVEGPDHDGADPTPSPAESARRAVEASRFKEVVEWLEPTINDLSGDDLVNLALAYDATGRRKEAVALLQGQGGKAGTDALGVLGGRYKREWLLTRKNSAGEKAAELYRSAYATAVKAADWPQAYYLGINVAFLQLLLEKDPAKARKTAEKVLGHCDSATIEERPGDKKWRLATQGEALLLLGKTGEALQRYADALACKPELNLRERGSMYRQAVLVADALGDTVAFEELRKLLGRD